LTYFFSKWVKLQFSRMETVDFERFAWKREE